MSSSSSRVESFQWFIAPLRHIKWMVYRKDDAGMAFRWRNHRITVRAAGRRCGFARTS
jgi:hypothetical protein